MAKQVRHANNPHQDGANLRAYYEWKNISEFAQFSRENGVYNKNVVDVGGSNRLYYQAPCEVISIMPECDFGDEERQYKRQLGNNKSAYKTRVVNDTFQNVIRRLNNLGKQELLRDKLYNFTDSVYYLSKLDLIEWASAMDDGIIGVGTAHIIADDNDGLLRCGKNIFGKVMFNKDSNTMAMKVVGNDCVYSHPIVFPELIKYDTIKIAEGNDYLGNKFKLLVSARDRFDFGATVYTRFVIRKVPSTQRVLSATTLWKRTCDHRNDATLNCGILYNKDGTQYTLDFEPGKNGVFNSKDDKTSIIYTTINSKIIAARVPKIVPQRENVLDTMLHFVDDMRTKVSYYQLNEQESSFSMPVNVFNDIVKQVLKAESIDRRTLLEILMLGNLRCPNVDMLEVLIPLINAALRQATLIETRIASMLRQSHTHLNNQFKKGEVEVNPKESIFMKLTRAILQPVDGDMDQEMAHALDMGF